MTADALRDRIAQAIESVAHEPAGGRPCELCVETADAVLAALADADPTDLGYEQVGIIRENDHIIRWDGGCRTSRVIERPVYARPRPGETPDG